MTAPTAPIVVKLGSSLVAHEDGRPRPELLARVAAAVTAAGAPVAIVSSGAIALGRAKAQGRGRASELARLQAASALGQTELQRLWQEAFAAHSLQVAQVLLTAGDLTERRSYVNVRAALTALFEVGAVPVINENDATATDEISFGDNDVLAAQTAVLLRARRLILLTNVEGILATPPGSREAQVVVDGGAVDDSMFGQGSRLGRGGSPARSQPRASPQQAASRPSSPGRRASLSCSPSATPALASLPRPKPSRRSSCGCGMEHCRQPAPD